MDAKKVREHAAVAWEVKDADGTVSFARKLTHAEPFANAPGFTVRPLIYGDTAVPTDARTNRVSIRIGDNESTAFDVVDSCVAIDPSDFLALADALRPTEAGALTLAATVTRCDEGQEVGEHRIELHKAFDQAFDALPDGTTIKLYARQSASNTNRIDPSWSLHDRVEFALRDAGFDYDEASRIAALADRPAPPVVGQVEQSHPMMGSGFMHVFYCKNRLDLGTKLFAASPASPPPPSKADVDTLGCVRDYLERSGYKHWLAAFDRALPLVNSPDGAEAVANPAVTRLPAADNGPAAGEEIRWTCSDSDEVYRGGNYDSELAAIAGALDNYPDAQTIYIGKIKPVDIRRLIRGDHLIEAIGERAYDEVGEVAEHWPELSKEDVTELEGIVAGYVLGKSPVTFFTVEGEKTYTREAAEALVESSEAPGS